VFRAHDTKLKRDVAIKVLPDEFARDADRLARFRREAEALASLNHPNVATIHDLAEADGVQYLVLELVEGDTLADLIGRGTVPIETALGIARQMADGLEAAHGKEIVHRDLKPANVKVTPEGRVKLLDFGLAKMRAEHPGAALSNSPTLMATTPGMILGTAAYLSPEQAKGREADRASDVWAFGCIVYEMLAGRAAFEGETVGEVLGGILKAEPEWSRLPAATPAGIRRLLRRCLRKERSHRLTDIKDARIEIEEAGSESEPVAVTRPAASRTRLAWTVAAVLGVIAAGAVAWALRPAPAAPEMRVEIVTGATSNPASLAISPDGRQLVFVANDGGRPRLWLRPLNVASARTLAGTDDARYPFWSPDSRSVGFFAEGKLKRIDVAGGSLQTLADVPNSRGGAWGSDDTILFAPSAVSPPFRVPASGGEPVAVTRLEPGIQNHRFPHFLPDGRRFLFHVLGGPDVRGVYLGQLDDSGSRRLFDADSAAQFVSGYLLFVRQGTLFAQRFDAAAGALLGLPVLVAEDVASVL
jgi:hypothetical protein